MRLISGSFPSRCHGLNCVGSWTIGKRSVPPVLSFDTGWALMLVNSLEKAGVEARSREVRTRKGVEKSALFLTWPITTPCHTSYLSSLSHQIPRAGEARPWGFPENFATILLSIFATSMLRNSAPLGRLYGSKTGNQ